MDQPELERLHEATHTVREALQRVVVGHSGVIEDVLVAVLCGGHVLLEGVPGVGKTLLVRTLSQCLDLRFARIQFTPDLMPADIIGTHVLEQDEGGGRRFSFHRGPLFAQVVLADEVNRATPKTQAALLEAMQEQRVTVGGETYTLGPPFFVLATQNPIEMEGTYSLPEAQLDRFFFKLRVGAPGLDELREIVDRTTGEHTPQAQRLLPADAVLRLQSLVRQVPMADYVRDYALRLVLATHPGRPGVAEVVDRYVQYGASPRGAQALVLAAKARAFLDARPNAAFEDVRKALRPALRHRILLTFEADAEGVTSDDLLGSVAELVPEEERQVS